ncbi:MAG: OFA family MFS transporter [Lachnospiraceae bacterium]|nr:OFA family MFS transporter [Lachnospiraceae bacterium]
MNEKKLVRWPYLFMGFMIFLFIGLIYAWSIFVVPLEEAFGWIRSDTSNVFSVVLIFFSLGSLVGGFMTKKFSVKFIVRLSALLLMAGFILSTRVTSLYQFYITYGVMCSTGVGMSYTSVAGAVVKWFPDKTGTANGILFVGFGLAAMVLGWFVNLILEATGWKMTFTVLGIAFGIILMLAVHKLDAPGSDVVFPETLSKRKSVTVFPDRDYTTQETMKRLTFWKIFIWAMFLCAAAYAVIGSVSPAVVSVGASLSLGALATGFVSVFNGGSRVLWGAMYDKLGMRITIMTVSTVFIIGSTLAIVSVLVDSVVSVIIAFLFTGFGFGDVPTVASTTINKMYGKKYYSANFSVYMLTCIPAAFLGPALSGVLVTASGSYFSTYCMMLLASVIGTAIALTIKKP